MVSSSILLIMAPLFLLVLIFSAISALPHQERVKRVVKGSSTPIETVPYQVALVFDNFPICGGSILQKNVIITAAHCCCSYLPNETLIYAGMYNKEDMPSLKGIKIKDVKIHEKYNYTGEPTPDDIALLVLEEDLVFGPTIRKVDLVEEAFDVPINATISGWGSTNCNFNLSSEQACNGWFATELQSGTLTIQRRENGLVYAPSTEVTGNYGDSGSPVVANGKLIGVARNCDIVKPGIFDFDATSILDYLPWIKSKLESIQAT